MSESIGILLSDAARLLRRRFDARARAVGVSRPQWQALIAIARREGTNQATLAEVLEVNTITVARMVDRLEAAGLIERRADPGDRRAWRLHLTPRAHPLLDELRTIADDVREEMLAGLDEPQQLMLTALLERVRGNLSPRDTGVKPGPW